jgi:hypothetical protein
LQVRWYPDPLLRFILYFNLVLLVFSGLILFRGLAVQDSAWSVGGWTGRGVEGDWLWMFAMHAWAWLLQFFGWRGAPRKIFPVLLLSWQGFLATLVSIGAVSSGEFILEGQIIGLQLNLKWVGPFVFGGSFLGALLWVGRDLRATRNSVPRRVSPLNRNNRIALVLAIAMIPTTYWIFTLSEPDNDFDILGLLAVIVHSGAMLGSFQPVNAYSHLHRILAMDGSAPR